MINECFSILLANHIAVDDPLDWDPDHKYHGPTINLNERQAKHAKDQRRLVTARTQCSS